MKKRKWIIRTIVIILFMIVISTILIRLNKSNMSMGWKKYNKDGTQILGDENTGSLFDPNVIRDYDGMYRMYVSWRKNCAIAVSTSNDGINWSELKIVLDKNNESGWEDEVNRATVIMKDGKYYMWYTGQSNNQSKIGYAVSEDGYVWNRREEPVIIPEYDFEKMSVMNPYVIYENDIYKMYYAAGETYEPDVIAYATSEDGINWNKYEENPILEANKDKLSLDRFKVGACEVIKNSNDKYNMFYIGYSDINTARIFIAKSKDGINWKRNKIPIIYPTKGKFDSEATYKPAIIYDDENNRYLIYYNGRTENREYIGLYYKEL